MHLDTHAVVWLYCGETERFSPDALKSIEREEILVSPMAVLELQYLHEVQRLAVPAPQVVTALAEEIGLRICQHSFANIVNQGLRETWTRDPFDRLIVAHARAAHQPLLTKNERIQSHYAKAFW